MDTQTNPNIVYFAKLHWIIFFYPVLLLLASLGLGLYFPQAREVSLLLSLFAVLWIVVTWFTYHFSSLTIQKKQVILRTGFLVRQTIDVPITKIETIDIRQTLFGSMLNYGSLVLTGTGGTHQYINFLQRPLTCRRYIEQLMNDHG